jgi:hypothetical protein
MRELAKLIAGIFGRIKTQHKACVSAFKFSEVLVFEAPRKCWPESTGTANLGLVQASYSTLNVSNLFLKEPTFGEAGQSSGTSSKASSS